MFKLLFIIYIICFSVSGTYAQFVVDTEKAVIINAPFGVFSTFTDKNPKIRFKKVIGSESFPAAIQIIKHKSYSIRIDSMKIKTQEIDSLGTHLKIFVAKNGYLKTKSDIKNITRKGNIYSFTLVDPIEISSDTAYLFLFFSFSKSTDFYVYANPDIKAATSMYDMKQDKLYIGKDNNSTFIGAPQIKLYYTKLWRD